MGDNIKMDFQEVGWGGCRLYQLARDERPMVGLVRSGSIKLAQFLEKKLTKLLRPRVSYVGSDVLFVPLTV
jgi:hypothetical protein